MKSLTKLEMSLLDKGILIEDKNGKTVLGN